MSIPFQCTCGKNLRVKDELAGRKVRCPGCQGILVVPFPEMEPVEESEGYGVAEEEAPAPRRKASPSALETEDRLDRPDYRPRREEPELRRERPRRRRKNPRVGAFERGWSGSVNGALIGGVLMMVFAVVWFGLGLMVGFIFFYPPVLFLIGAIVFICGLFSR